MTCTGIGFLDMTLKTQAAKEKTDKLHVIKNFNFCDSSYIIKKLQTTHKMGENIGKSYIFRC